MPMRTPCQRRGLVGRRIRTPHVALGRGTSQAHRGGQHLASVLASGRRRPTGGRRRAVALGLSVAAVYMARSRVQAKLKELIDEAQGDDGHG